MDGSLEVYLAKANGYKNTTRSAALLFAVEAPPQVIAASNLLTSISVGITSITLKEYRKQPGNLNCRILTYLIKFVE